MTDSTFERIRDDPGLRVYLQTARAWGVSPRRFFGWEPARTLVHHYGADGRLRRTVETIEEEWDDDSRDLVVALAMWEADLCPGCRQPMSETTKAENEGLYLAKAPIRCHWCTASHQASEVYAEAPHAQALFIPMEVHGSAEALDVEREHNWGGAANGIESSDSDSS